MNTSFASQVISWLINFLNFAGDNPFAAMWHLFLHGGWILFAWFAWWVAKELWLHSRQHAFAHHQDWILLRIKVPHTSEQTPKAVENIFAILAGAHRVPTWKEKWIDGLIQTKFGLEIAFAGGRTYFYVYAERAFRYLVESAIYSQYPDAEIMDVTDQDYSYSVPDHYPDPEWEFWGCEIVPVKSDAYPIKTYLDFEDKISGEIKDPMSGLLQNFSHLSSDEQVWFQIIITPTDQKEERARAEALINKLKGIKEEHHAGFLEQVLEFPFTMLRAIGGVLLGGGGGGHDHGEKKEEFPKMMRLSPGEKNVLEAVERKVSKVGFVTKIRFVYAGKKTIFQKSRALHPFIGALKQTNTFDMQALKPETKLVGVSGAIWWFKDQRNNARKNKIVSAYRHRSNWAGISGFFLSAEELATLWHFPILTQVKAFKLERTEAKKKEAPANIPFET